ncbi:MAG: ABC transporter permease [Actinomycetota bacterium]|nr:ABC transporter permease [Actinomycetota bacterium]
MNVTGALRAAPPVLRPHRAWHVVERNLRVYRRTWLVLLTGLLEPIVYLLCFRVGLAELIGDVDAGAGRIVPYLTFVAPGLLAASMMNGSIFDTTFNVFFKMRYEHTYDAMLTTPIRVVDVVAGELAWAMGRNGVYATSFFVVMAVAGTLESWWAVLAIPAATLVCFAFGGLGLAMMSFLRSWEDFDRVMLVIMPLYLFSATFYPLSVYPRWAEIVVQLTPLYHGVTLVRALTLGDVGPVLMVHVAVLVALGCAGLAVANRRLTGRLLA